LILYDLEDKKVCWNLKEEAIDRTVWRNRLGSGCGEDCAMPHVKIFVSANYIILFYRFVLAFYGCADYRTLITNLAGYVVRCY